MKCGLLRNKNKLILFLLEKQSWLSVFKTGHRRGNNSENFFTFVASVIP